MKKFLRHLGFDMKPAELQALIDAFDSNGDGKVTVAEFTDFVGPKRDKKGGVSLVIGQKCCWQTTCKKTGMANAYSVSIKDSYSSSREYKSTDSKLGSSSGGGNEAKRKEDEEEESIANRSGKVLITKLANGKTKVLVELKERQRREDVLARFRLIKSTPSSSTYPGKNMNTADSKNGYDDEEEAENNDYNDDDFEDNSPNSPNRNNKKKKGTTNSCSCVSWSLQDRKDGLNYLMDITKDARQEQLIKKLMENGTPPNPPKLKIALPTDPFFRDDKEAMTTELLLLWGPDKSSDLVSFYSLEFSGAVGAVPGFD